MFSAVIFDLDGTLVNTPALIARTVGMTLTAKGYDAPPEVDVLPFIGLPLEAVFGHFLPIEAHAGIPGYIDLYRAIYNRVALPETRPYPGVTETLAGCRAAGLKLALATTKFTSIAEASLVQIGVRDLFDEVFGGDRAARPKPYPDMVEGVLAALKRPAGETLMVGDTLYDMQMGRSAGVRTCAVTYGVHTRETLLEAQPDHVIDSFEQLSGILDLRA